MACMYVIIGRHGKGWTTTARVNSFAEFALQVQEADRADRLGTVGEQLSLAESCSRVRSGERSKIYSTSSALLLQVRCLRSRLCIHTKECRVKY